ncbi:MAG: SHOCT domain-containing protein [Rubripirellula sp.]
MPNLSAAGNQFVQSLSQRHGISTDGATHMLIAVHNGNGTMSQFNHPDFGGCGQWMQGGMTMVSDLFNNQLKYRVDSVCNDIANELAANQLIPFSGSFQSQSQNGSSAQAQAAGVIGSNNSLFGPDPATNWWPNELGAPSAIGSQNNVRYAYFPINHRLAVTTGGEAWVYDTMDHQIGGFSQQQGTGGSITFTSQFGTVSLSSLPLVSRGGVPQTPTAASPAPPSLVVAPEPPNQSPAPVPTPPSESMEPTHNSSTPEDVIDTLNRLGGLMEKGYITAEEFDSKKSELLGRL